MELIQMKPSYVIAKRRLNAELKMVKSESAKRSSLTRYKKNVVSLRYFAKNNLLDLSTMKFID